jgi:uncharacterized protein (TIRG00374 family)
VKYLVLAGKLAITGFLVWVIVRYVDLAPMRQFLHPGRAATAMLLCVGILIGQATLAALRLRLIMRLMGASCPFHVAFGTWMIGLIISQAMVTFIAGDAARIWQLARRGYGRRLSGGAIFLERALGFAVLMGLVLLCMPFLLDHATGPVRAGLVALASLCAVGITGFMASAFLARAIARLAPQFFSGRIAAGLVDIASAARHLSSSWSLTGAVIALSVIMHLVNAATFVVLGTAVGVELDPATVAIVALPVMLIALMPIALAGWGVREGAAVVGYGLFGVPPEAALAMSIGFGLALLLASLPGGLYLWMGKRIGNAPAADELRT